MIQSEKSKNKVPYIIFCLIFTMASFSNTKGDSLEYTAPEVEIQLSYGRFPDKVGEDIPAHKLGNWRMYKANPLTYKEKKTRPFWVYTMYHGGWYRYSGYQPKKGGFHLLNSFGVWEHDPNQDNLNFKFIWPFERTFEYDIANDCYWQIMDVSYLIQFSVDSSSNLINIHKYKIPFNKYLFTDKDRVLWFNDNGCIVIRNDQLFVKVNASSQTPDLTFEQTQQKADTIYRALGGYLQEYKSYMWTICTIPQSIGSRVYSVDQLDDNVLISSQGTYEWYTKYGIYFKLSKGSAEWVRYDRDGRKWLATSSGLFCLDDTDLQKPTYAEFVTLLPQILDEDQVVASEAMKRLLEAGQLFKSYVAENKSHENANVRKAVSLLTECIKGENELIFTGDSIIFQQLLDGKGTVPEPLPIPEKNIEDMNDFIETDPLILDTNEAGVLRDAFLIELPIFDHIGFTFYDIGNVLVSRNSIVNKYFKVTHDQENFVLIPKEAPSPIWNTCKSENPNEILAAIQSSIDGNIILTGKMDINSGSFQALGSIPRANYFGAKFVIDSQNRVLFITNKGGIVFYQNKPNGEFIKSEINNPMYPRYGDIVTSDKDGRIFIYRSFYERAWDGEISKVFEFKDGQLLPLDLQKPGHIIGHIYNMALVSDDTLLAVTQDPKRLFFIDSRTGKTVEPIFDINNSKKPGFFYISGIHDKQERFWFYTISLSENDQQLHSIQMWDGEILTTIVEWFTEKRSLNPYSGNMCITDDSLIWIGLNEKILIIDSKTFDYRFFRAFDRLGVPELFALDKCWITANYGENTTVFHLKFKQENFAEN